MVLANLVLMVVNSGIVMGNFATMLHNFRTMVLANLVLMRDKLGKG
jgi:hypothetical protein